MYEEPSSFTILCLDDSEAQLSELVGALRGVGYQSIGVTNVDDARNHVPQADLVIVDFHMPRINGADALVLLRGSVSHDRAPLFFLYTTDKDAAVSFKAFGFDGAFTAKGDMETLLSQVETALRRLKLKRFMKVRTAR
jgi:CheY-like chemotaxis protein